MAFSTTVLAYSYDFAFDLPYADRIESTPPKTVSGNPYVDPVGSAATTMYFFSPAKYSSKVASNIISKSNGFKSAITFTSGYGGFGTGFCLSSYPAAIDLVCW